jgi:hypothetical protein
MTIIPIHISNYDVRTVHAIQCSKTFYLSDFTLRVYEKDHNGAAEIYLRGFVRMNGMKRNGINESWGRIGQVLL